MQKEDGQITHERSYQDRDTARNAQEFAIRHAQDLERLRVLLVLPLPHQLRVEGRIAGIQDGRRPVLVRRDEAAQLLRRNVRPRVLMLDRLDGRRA